METFGYVSLVLLTLIALVPTYRYVLQRLEPSVGKIDVVGLTLCYLFFPMVLPVMLLSMFWLSDSGTRLYHYLRGD